MKNAMISETSFANNNYRSQLFSFEYNERLTPNVPINFSDDLCWLLGLLHGDGNMSNGRVLFCDKNQQFHRNATHKAFTKVFGIKLNFFHDVKRNSFYSHVKNKKLY